MTRMETKIHGIGNYKTDHHLQVYGTTNPIHHRGEYQFIGIMLIDRIKGKNRFRKMYEHSKYTSHRTRCAYAEQETV